VAFFSHHRAPGSGAKPTVVIVHGAFADSTAFGDVASHLADQGFPLIGVAAPLRDLAGDAAYVRSVLAAVDGPVLLVGHCYAGSVITQAAAGAPNVTALVYVAGFIPEIGESSAALNGKFPGSLLTPENLIANPTPDGCTDLYIKPEKYGEVYAGGLSAAQIAIAAFAQRPITSQALGGAATQVPSADVPRWQVVATQDNSVPTELQRFMAERAGAHVIEADCGHDVAAAQPTKVLQAIIEAAGDAA
jgi:pimeloyl-ACP methyl ester carboxylesterase